MLYEESRLMKYKCKECGAEFKDMPSKTRSFCSRECFVAYMKRVMEK